MKKLRYNTRRISPHILKQMQRYSEFQQKVWMACAAIPRGEVRTYRWIAEHIGRPKAVRAVGSALGKNPFAPIIPCHRVIKSDGTLGGYSGLGGVKTKKEMLKKEGARHFRFHLENRKP